MNLEDVLDGFAGALEYFAGTFCGADTHVLAGTGCAFAEIRSGIDRMECDPRSAAAFPVPFGCAADAFRRTFTDISCSSADVTFGAGG